MSDPILTKSPQNGKPCPGPRRRNRRPTPFAKMPAAKQAAIRDMITRIKAAYYGGGL